MAGKRPFLYCSLCDVPCHASVRAGALGCQNRKTHGQAWLLSMLLWHMTKAPLSARHKKGDQKWEQVIYKELLGTRTGKDWLTFRPKWVCSGKIWSSPLSSFVSLPYYEYHTDNSLSLEDDIRPLSNSWIPYFDPTPGDKQLFFCSLINITKESQQRDLYDARFNAW